MNILLGLHLCTLKLKSCSFPSEDAFNKIKQPWLPHYPTFILPFNSKKFDYVRLCNGMNWSETLTLCALSTARLPPPVHKRHRPTRHILGGRRCRLLPVQRVMWRRPNDSQLRVHGRPQDHVSSSSTLVLSGVAWFYRWRSKCRHWDFSGFQCGPVKTQGESQRTNLFEQTFIPYRGDWEFWSLSQHSLGERQKCISWTTALDTFIWFTEMSL